MISRRTRSSAKRPEGDSAFPRVAVSRGGRARYDRCVARASRAWPEAGRGQLVDATLALGIAALNITGSIGDDPSAVDGVESAAPLWAVPLLVVPAASLFWRRRFPVVPIVLCTALLAVLTAAGWQVGSTPGTLMVAAYALGSWASPPQRHLGLVPPLGLMCVLAATGNAYFDTVLGVTIPAVLLSAWGFGAVARRRRIRDDEMRECEQIAAIHDAIEAERRRIARDLHDVVTHTLSVVAVHAGATRHRANGDPAIDEPLRIIESASRSALEDLRRMLGLLRDTEAAPSRSAGSTLEDLEALVAAHRRAHGGVSLDLDPAVAAVPASVRQSVYRIVQEALTNASKHAAGAAVRVGAKLEGQELVVVVDDDGPCASVTASSARPAGFGLAGMRERVAVFGGTLTVGGRSDGPGFRVVARIPVDHARLLEQVPTPR